VIIRGVTGDPGTVAAWRNMCDLRHIRQTISERDESPLAPLRCARGDGKPDLSWILA